MSLAMLLAAVQLVTVHMIDGRAVQINPRTVTRLQEARADDHPGKQLAKGIRCVIWFVDGTYLSIAETCPEARALVEQGEP
jgi:hypothetical protein